MSDKERQRIRERLGRAIVLLWLDIPPEAISLRMEVKLTDGTSIGMERRRRDV